VRHHRRELKFAGDLRELRPGAVLPEGLELVSAVESHVAAVEATARALEERPQPVLDVVGESAALVSPLRFGFGAVESRRSDGGDAENAALRREVESLRRENDALVAEKAALHREVESLRRENACVTPSPDSESDLD